MRSVTRFLTALAAVASLLPSAIAQESAPVKYKDAGSGITFDTWSVPNAPPIGDSQGPNTAGGLTFGVSLPPDSLTKDADEFIGYLNCAIKNGTTGWCGISFGGAMTNSLLLVVWPYNNTVLTSFRFATSYSMPQRYRGNAVLTQISSNITETHLQLVFRCQNCLKWSHGGQIGVAPTSSKQLLLGWVQAYPSPGNAQCPDFITLSQHNNGMNIWAATLSNGSVNPTYTVDAAKATKTVEGNCTGFAETTVSAVPVPTGISYDYIIVGAGAGGIPIADKLSEAGKSVLLIEKGPVSSGRWGGTLKPHWLEGTNLTRFDVPGLCNQIWVDAGGIACTDTDQMAGCVLGGGTAVNAGLWWKPYSLDWDYIFPEGWKYKDVTGPIKRVFSRIPGTDAPSMDGKRYLQQGFEVLAAGLKNAGWKQVTANDAPDEKNRTYAHSPFMYSGGERGGPLATYLVTAHSRSNFKLWTITTVKRVVREGGHITGVEVEAFRDGGYAGVVNITSISGRVILSAGAFGSPKILFRSGIGPADQLEVVQNSETDSDTMISNSSWINLPIGYNLVDHVNTDTVVTHPDVVFYDFYEAWTNVSASDKETYLTNRTGILAQAAPNIGPIFWDQIKGADGIVRQFQWQARVEGAAGTPSGQAMTISQYLGRGSTSRGRMTITPNLDTVVSTLPYLNDQHDKDAVVQALVNVQSALSKVANLTYTYPNATTNATQFVDTMIVSYSNRRANHWMGTNKLGLDDGRVGNGTAVVDLDTKVYGTDNLFVVDAGIFPGMITTNPSAYFVVASEHAAERLLKLAAPVPGVKGAQCGGAAHKGSFLCSKGLTCTWKSMTSSVCE